MSTNTKSASFQAIDQNAELICGVNDRIWEYAELSLLEYKSAKLYCEVLEGLGFFVQKGICGMETAFSASFGHGAPVIGILAEYDALSGLSQQGGALFRNEIVPGGSGHGCGHSMLGAGALAAAIGIQRYLENAGQQGTVVLYGCPGEEGGAAKAFMAREGLWKQLDAALTWHPDDVNEIATGTCNSCIQKEYKFSGVSAHAAGDPHLGRSGLDAVELMNIGVQFLREHMPETGRVHYAITDAGGHSPNVVQPYAQVLYMVRDIKVSQTLALQGRVDKIAQAAAMMTDTKLTVRFIDGCANTVPNFTLEKLLHQNMEAIGAPKYTEEETAFAQALFDTVENRADTLPGFAAKHDQQIAQTIANLTDSGKKPLNDFVVPYFSSHMHSFGSTDVGDVSWLTPTAQFRALTYPSNTPGHSWQNVSCGVSSIGHKGALYAGKVLAAAAIDLYEQPEILKAAAAEFAEKTAEGYQCPVPPEAIPTAVGGTM